MTPESSPDFDVIRQRFRGGFADDSGVVCGGLRSRSPTTPESSEGFWGQGSTGGSGASAGPEITCPRAVNREPWHGQSHVRSAGFQAT